MACRATADAAEHEDHAVALPDHVPGGRAGGQEHRARRRPDGTLEVIQRHLGERRALHVTVGDQVERDVDAAGPRGDLVGVLVDGRLVERVKLRRVNGSAAGADVRRDLLQPRPGAPGEVHRGALPGEGARHRTADRAAPAVDDRVLSVEQHGFVLLSRW